ncbi:MAG: T9SS C-terminal target domain-containing protein [Calditrichaeota bacterium]|nr:MAG: T9SS C-terminal target domain-containing protein [Calditrichota bacterium]
MKRHIRNLTILLFYFPFQFFAALTFAQMYELHTTQAGLFQAIQTNGVAVADYNNDGFLDIYFVTRAPSTSNPFISGGANLLYKNNGDGTFTEVAEQAGVQGIDGRSVEPNLAENYGAAWGDFDNDGDVDLYLTNKGVDELYENLGDGTFRNITHSARMDSIIRESTSAAWFDYDNDGLLDLYVCAYGKYGVVPSSANVLYHNLGNGTFVDVAAKAGVADPGFTYTTMIFDANQDGWQDVYCVNDFGANHFYLNLGNGTFREATKEFGLENEGHGMGATLGDYNNDGLLDLYLTNIADDPVEEWNPLFKQVQAGKFVDVSRQVGTQTAGWGWGVEFLDFDLDGFLDIYAVNGFYGVQWHNYLYYNNGDGTFSDMSQQSGVDSESEARGLCVADVNDDGRLDLIVANWREVAHLYLNMTRGGHYLKVNLIGTRSNRDARGALVIAEADNKSYLRSNDGIDFLGQSKTPVHFGLGDSKLIHKLVVIWPTGEKQEFMNLPADQTLTIQEEKGIVTAVENHSPGAPRAFRLLPSYPNPLRQFTRIRFQLARDSHARIEVYDILGKRVATVADQFFAAGQHTLLWSPAQQGAGNLPAGIYFIRYTNDKYVEQQKIVVLK